MKNQKETKQDELAAIGIGAMIVFIALILVAAVAAAVIIQTAEKLQQNAQASGDDTQEQMSTKITLINIIIEATAAAPANHDLFVTFELAPGSEPTQSDDVGYTVICLDDQGTNDGGTDDTTEFAQGDLTGATVHTGDGAGAAASGPRVRVWQFQAPVPRGQVDPRACAEALCVTQARACARGVGIACEGPGRHQGCRREVAPGHESH